jgi:hypothetical protein
LLRARRERPGSRRAAEQRDELASFQLIELHSVPSQAGAGLQDIELARISQEVTERFCDLLAVGEGAEETSEIEPSAEPSVGRLARLRSGQSVGVTSMTAAIS